MERLMPKMIFVNLPVADVEKSVDFYEAIGFTKDARFSRPGSAAAMVCLIRLSS
jgi:uncharacterized protein